MSPEHTEIIQVIRDTADMLLVELAGRIDNVEHRLDIHDQRFVSLEDTIHQHQDIVLRRLERIEDEYTATNALLRRHGILRTAG